MDITLHYGNNPPFVLGDHKEKGLGGTENFACYVARELARAGHTVHFYNLADLEEPTDIQGVQWANIKNYDPNRPTDVLVSFRMREVFEFPSIAKLKVLILADTESAGLGYDVKTGRIDVVMGVSEWQIQKIAAEEGIAGHPGLVVASNGVDLTEFANGTLKKRGKCIFLSTPERGLDNLLNIWPRIETTPAPTYHLPKNVVPELHLFSSFLGWGTSTEDNEAMSKAHYDKIEQMIESGSKIVNHKHVSRDVIRQHQNEADLFLYPSNFFETYCISLTECMAAGVIPIVSAKAALPERVSSGVNGFLVGNQKTDAYSESYRKDFVEKTRTALWLSDNVAGMIRKQARQTASKHNYNILVPEWARMWEARL